VTYLSYCRNLKFEDKPDYNYLKGLFKDLFTKSGFDFDYQYDWNSQARKKKDEKKETDGTEEQKIDLDKPNEQKIDDAERAKKQQAEKIII